MSRARILRSVIAMVILLAAALPSQAQKHYREHLWVGVHGGLSMSRQSFSPSIDQKMHNGFTGGVTFRYAEEKIFGLIGELNLVQRGWQENFKDNPELSYKRNLTYISLPIMTHIYFGSRRFKGFVNLGPEISYMLSEDKSANFDYSDPTAAEIPATRVTRQMTMDIKNRFDYGITAGVGVEFYLRPRHSLVLEARYYFGLGNIFPSTKADYFSASRASAIQVTLGYNFRLR
mgnify:FL=1